MRIFKASSFQENAANCSIHENENLVRYWGILTALKPVGKKTSVNKSEVLEGLKSAVRMRGLREISIKDRAGSAEKSILVVNIEWSEMCALALQFGQESFIFADCRNGLSDVGHYKLDAGKKSDKYVLRSRCSNIYNMSDADEFFKFIKSSFKYQIPLLDGCDETVDCSKEDLLFLMNRHLIKKYGYQGVEHLKKLIDLSFNSGISLRKKYSLRASIYEEKSSRLIMCRRILEFLNELLSQAHDEERVEIEKMIADIQREMQGAEAGD